MAWAFKKNRSLWNDGACALLIAAVVICLLMLLGFSDDSLAAPVKFNPRKIKWLEPFISDTKWLDPYISKLGWLRPHITKLKGLVPYISRENFLITSVLVAASALFVGIVQGTKAVARKLIKVCARTYRGFARRNCRSIRTTRWAYWGACKRTAPRSAAPVSKSWRATANKQVLGLTSAAEIAVARPSDQRGRSASNSR